MTARPEDNSPDRLIRIDEVMRWTGLKRSQLYKLIKTGKFPKPVKIGERCVAWRLSEVEEWIRTRPRTTDQ